MPNKNFFKTLVISNIAETYYKTYKKAGVSGSADQQSAEIDLLEADRAVLYKADHKAVITSYPVDSEYLNDLQKILPYRSLLNLYPQKPTERLSKDILSDKHLLSQVSEIVRENPGISIIPYFATEEFFDLISFLKHKQLKFSTPETVSAKNRFIRDHFNCKVGFRKLWERIEHDNSFVKIPRGFIVDDLGEAIDAAWWFYQHKTNFVMKYNRGTSGLGIVFYKCQDLPRDEKLFSRFLRRQHHQRIWFEENFVVEEFIDVASQFYGGSPSVEFLVNDNVTYLYNSFQKLGENAFFEGIIIGRELEEQSGIDFNRVIENCRQYAEALAEFGYKGIFDVDLVIDKKHNIFAVESNLRRTGGTHIFELSRYLFGRNFLKKTVVISRDNLPVGDKINSYRKFKQKTKHLFYSPKKREGIIPNISSLLTKKKIGFVAFAKNIERVNRLEKELIKTVV